ncbi:hypothetical protein BMT54_03795 [Pasteurellaceae bacterium 15-036681]|nr:hypothetical protein BMT54_03795 [Pasteurellaceae bacterium 15-036681]
MRKLKLSPIYVALFLSGGLSSVSYAQGVDCAIYSINAQMGTSLKNCSITTVDENSFRALGITDSKNILLDNVTIASNKDNLRINSSTVTIKDSNFEAISESQGFGAPSFISALSISENSDVNIENSIINTKPTSSSQFNIQVDSSNLTLLNSTIRMQKSGDYVGEASSALDVTNGTVIVKDSVFDLDARADSYISTSNNGKIILENTKSTDVRAYPDFLTIGEGKSKVDLINSSFQGGIGSIWHLTKEVEQADLDLTLTNSSLKRGILFYSTGIPPYSEDSSRTKQIIENINVVAKDSSLEGAVRLLPNSVGIIDDTFNVTLENSSWNLGTDSYISSPNVTNLFLTNSNVTVNSGYVYLDGNDKIVYKFRVFNILGNLSGTGNFTLSTDLASQQSDKVVVQGSDSGSFGLNIKDSGNEPDTPNGKVTLIETQTGTADFSLLNRDYVDAGAYRYRLAKEGTNWILSNKEAEKAKNEITIPTVEEKPEVKPTPIVETKPEVKPTPIVENKPAVKQPEPVMLSEKSNALVSLRQAQLVHIEQNLAGIHQRLGETKSVEKGNVWVKNLNSRSDVSRLQTANNSQSSGFSQDYHGVQVGSDIATSDNFRVGGFVGAAKSDVDFNGKYGSGKVNNQSVGLYGTLLADNGLYWDNIVKYDRLNAKSNATGKRSYNGYTVSTEVGRIHTLGNGWTITPQVQLAWSKLSSKADEDSLSALYTRVGARVAKNIEFATWSLQPYAEVNGVNVKNNSSKVRVNQYDFDVASMKSRIETALGFSAKAGNHRLGLEAKVSNGKRLDQPFAVQAMYRYQW